jgi:hypothetical protein
MPFFQSVARWIQAMSVVRRARAGPRVVVNEQALLHIPGRRQTHPVLLRDLAIGGSCIRTDLRLLAGEDLWLCVDAGLESQFETNAAVLSVRHETNGFYTDYGLRFVGMSLHDAQTLTAFITARLDKQDAAALAQLGRNP